jgi:hypothetical protein
MFQSNVLSQKIELYPLRSAIGAVLPIFIKKAMLNTNLTQDLKDEFIRESGSKLSPDNNPSEFAVFLYEKLLSNLTDAIKEELTRNPEGKPYLDSFQKNLDHKFGSSFH